ncbi:hypothetical protein [Neomoorella glycerini]|uniref:hypothetical protein n=1 Tax=Neomoorella glycerini TaxID=55779 RepID=UPI001B8C2866|nr:hypothetical protein [Moorella glycerini]
MKLLLAAGITGAGGLGLEQAARAAGRPEPFPELPQKQSGQKPEALINTKNGQVMPAAGIIMRHSACLGCYSCCGNRVKIDASTGEILQVFGNPYNPLNSEPHLPYEAPLTEAYLAFSNYQGKGNTARATLCARGLATLQAHQDPMRLLVPLKRAGKRGEGKWQPITWEEAVNETIEGGKLFSEIGENQEIEGLRHVRDFNTLIDPNRPELGPKVNQLVFFGGRDDGRMVFASRFMRAFGSINYFTHGST